MPKKSLKKCPKESYEHASLTGQITGLDAAGKDLVKIATIEAPEMPKEARQKGESAAKTNQIIQKKKKKLQQLEDEMQDKGCAIPSK
jgi:hypothetical protein